MVGWWIAGSATLVLIALVARPLRRMYRDVSTERAHELFQLQREKLEASFLELARSRDLPRGDLWKHAIFSSPAHFARHRKTAELVAFVEVDFPSTPAPIEFPAPTTAVFQYRHGHWGTIGRSLPQISPEQALVLYQAEYEPISFPDDGR
jgi:hypothetical protein